MKLKLSLLKVENIVAGVSIYTSENFLGILQIDEAVVQTTYFSNMIEL